MNILITGGAGFIGSHTADALILKGHHVRILDILKKPVHLKGFPEYLDRSKVEFIFGDVNDKESQVATLVEDDRMYHLLEHIGTKPNVFYHVKVRNDK